MRNLIQVTAIGLLAAGLCVQASAATITVTTFTDENDGGVGGTGISLRDAIITANGSAAVDDVIMAPPGTYNLTITGGTATTGDLNITGTGALTIQSTVAGSSVAINQMATNERVMDKIDGATGLLTLIDVTLTGGRTTGTGSEDGGAGLRIKDGGFTATRVVFDGNEVAGGASPVGGGLHFDYDDVNVNYDISITDCAFINNICSGRGGGASFDSDASDGKTINIIRTTFANNQASDEGGLQRAAIYWRHGDCRPWTTGVLRVSPADSHQSSAGRRDCCACQVSDPEHD